MHPMTDLQHVQRRTVQTLIEIPKRSVPSRSRLASPRPRCLPATSPEATNKPGSPRRPKFLANRLEPGGWRAS